MSQPRQILSNATYLITRRAILRHMLFRPDGTMTQILVYLLAVAAHRDGLQVHAFCAMSTHLHLVVTDTRGALPSFLQFFHRLVALCTKKHRGWQGPVWDKDPTSVVRLETPAAVVEKIAYVLANPVSAGLVRHAHEWPGAKVLVDEIGRGVLHEKRPTVYLSPKNKQWTEEATLPISLPPCIEPEHADVFRRQIASELERLEAHAHAEMQQQDTQQQDTQQQDTQQQQRRSFGSAEQAMQVSPEARATSAEPAIALNPTFAVGRQQGDAMRRAIDAVRAFRESYRAALKQWREGDRSAVFPAGTWWMRVFHLARVNDVVMAV